MQVPDALQVKALVNLLLHDEPSAALIFTKTKQQTEEVAEHLTVAGQRPTAVAGQAGVEHLDTVMWYPQSGLQWITGE